MSKSITETNELSLVIKLQLEKAGLHRLLNLCIKSQITINHHSPDFYSHLQMWNQEVKPLVLYSSS